MIDGSWRTKVTQSISEEKEEVSHQDEDPDVLHHLWIVWQKYSRVKEEHSWDPEQIKHDDCGYTDDSDVLI